MNILPPLEKLFLVITTECNKEKAKALSEIILIKKLAACVNYIEINSSYWWEGSLVNENEVQMIFKTNYKYLEPLIKEIKKSHTYQIPEVIFFEVDSIKVYSKWLNSTLV